MDSDYPLVLVTWLDITATAGWEPASEVEPMEVKTLGWLVHEDEKVLKVGNSLGEDGDVYGISALPIGCVVGITTLSATVVSHQVAGVEPPAPSLQHQQGTATLLQSV